MTRARWTSAAARLGVAAVVACLLAPATAQAQVAPPTATAFFSQDFTTAGTDVGMGLAVANPNLGLPLTGVGVGLTLPAGLVISTPSQLTTTCDGTVTAVDAGTQITLSGATLPAADDPGGASNSCSVQLDVVAAGSGVLSIATGAPTSDQSGAGLPSAPASLQVLDAPTIAESFDDATIVVGETARVTYTMGNPNALTRLYGLAFDDALPAGLAVAPVPNVGETCVTEGVLADPGATSIRLLGLIVEAASQCSVSVDVVGIAATTSPNPTGPLTFSYDAGGGDFRSSTAPGATATLVVLGPPQLTLAFGSSAIALGATTTLTAALLNPNPALALTGIGFSAALPAGLVVATPSGLSGGCGGATITADAGSGTIAVGGATLAATTGCAFSVTVQALSAGAKTVTTSAVSSTEVATGPAASASLLVAAPPALGAFPPPPPAAPQRPSNRYTVKRFRLARDGTARFDVTVAGAGDVLALATVGASLRVRRPGPGRLTLSRKTVHATKATTLHVTLRPNRTGRRFVQRATRSLRVTVWVSFRPTGGTAGKVTSRSATLRRR